MRRSAILLAVVSLAALPLLGSVTPVHAQMVAPPPPRAEAMPPPPGARPGVYWVWQPGYWRWEPRRRQYVWFAGRYVHAPRARAAWVPGEWVLVRGRWVWHNGHWRR